MKIAHINLSNKNGGAANATMRLHKSLLKLGVNSKVFTQRLDSEKTPNIVSGSLLERKLFSNIRYLFARRKTSKRDTARGLFSADAGSSSVVNPQNFKDFDAIYIHWINHGMMSIKSIEKILQLNRPVYWVCHDMWPVTGGCHHSFECEKYKTHCGACPSFCSTKEKDISYKLFAKKLIVFEKYPNLHFIAISDFMHNVISESRLAKGHYIHKIPNTIDTDVFKPYNKSESRKSLGLPTDKKLLLFGADMGTSNPYKGWSYAKKAIEQLHQKLGDTAELVVFGASKHSTNQDELPIKVNYMGNIDQELTMAKLYSAVDVYINPSIAESLSYTTMEAIACGCRCVAFNVGGIPSIVNHLQNGYLAPLANVEELVEGTLWALESCNDTDVSEICHNSILGRFDTKTIAELHLFLLKDTIHCGM